MPRSAPPLIILAGCAILGILLVAIPMLTHLDRGLGPDGIEYISLAKSLVETGHFSRNAQREPELHRTPGYPLLLMLVQPWRSTHHLLILFLSQLLMTLVTAYLLLLISRRMSTTRSSWLLAPFLFLLNPIILLMPFNVIAETFFSLLCSLSLWLFSTSSGPSHTRRLALSGLTLGFAVLVRPVGLVLFPALFLLGMQTSASNGKSSKAPPLLPARRVVLVIIMSFLLLPTLWTVFNGIRNGYWGLSKTAISFISSAYGPAYIHNDSKTFRDSKYDHGLSPLDALTEVYSTIVHNPGTAFRSYLNGLARVILGPGEWHLRRAVLGERGSRANSGPISSVVMDNSNDGLNFRLITETESSGNRRGTQAIALVTWSLAVTLLTYAFAFRGLMRCFGSKGPIPVFCAAAAALLLTSVAGYEANARFRVPAVPYLVLLASYGKPIPAMTFSRLRERLRITKGRGGA